MKGYTDFVGGMFWGMEICKRADPSDTKYMDWNKVEKICLEHPNEEIEAGLREDWNNTSGIIFSKGKWVDGGVLYDQSRWATPIVDINGEEIECWTHTPHDRTGIPEWWGRGEQVYDEWDLDDEE